MTAPHQQQQRALSEAPGIAEPRGSLKGTSRTVNTPALFLSLGGQAGQVGYGTIMIHLLFGVSALEAMK